ncbi:hypothetical protein [Zoogloea sp.]|uniref:hypothetical protein n=1 Tax=Zoogloea sp. TaxID=49181 RepID=UPI00262ACE29|nr:hypothetical protein [uncultured Zoogloea sp.]
MVQLKLARPYGIDANPVIDLGTQCRAPSPLPGPAGIVPQDSRTTFDNAIRALEAETSNVGAYLVVDAQARRAYTRLIRQMADELAAQVRVGGLTWAQAAQEANQARDAIMEVIRGRSTPFGRAYAERLKAEGPTLNAMIARKTLQLFGKDAKFSALSAAQQNSVYAAIVDSAGKSNPRVTSAFTRLGRAGRGLLILSVGLSVYNVATADDKLEAAGHELAVTGGGIAGGMAGGAVAGLACGPGAPVCVAVGAFVGGALAAFGIDKLF